MLLLQSNTCFATMNMHTASAIAGTCVRSFSAIRCRFQFGYSSDVILIHQVRSNRFPEVEACPACVTRSALLERDPFKLYSTSVRAKQTAFATADSSSGGYSTPIPKHSQRAERVPCTSIRMPVLRRRDVYIMNGRKSSGCSAVCRNRREEMPLTTFPRAASIPCSTSGG